VAWNRVWDAPMQPAVSTASAHPFGLAHAASHHSPHRKTVKRDGVVAIAVAAPPDKPTRIYTHRGKRPAKRWLIPVESIDQMQQLSAFLQYFIFHKENFFLICGTNRLQATSKEVIGSEASSDSGNASIVFADTD
jgi:hypothetical protein